MEFRKMSWLVALLALGLWLGVAPLSAQDSLEELVEQSQEEEAELEQLPGTQGLGVEDEPFSGRVRLPTGEDVERLRISQDRQIDPDTYIIGPGDVLQLYIWGEFDLPYQLQVTPEGDVVIPTVEAFRVSDHTLTEVKQLILDAARAKYPGVEITVTLVSMRFFTVYVTGAVLREGSFIVQPTTRVSDLIERAGGYLDDLRGGTIEEDVGGKTVRRVRRFHNRPASRRSIQLIHGDGSTENVDLDMFLATGYIEFNPYVRMGDVVHINFREQEFYIYGATNREGKQEFRPGDTVDDLVTLANGLHSDAPLEKVEVWRFRENTEETEIITLGDNTIPEKQFVYDDIRDFPLAPKDMVFMRAISNWQQMPTVWVSGEVRNRGRYRITQGVTRLRDVIAEAGGLTEDASLIGAKLVRTKQRIVIDPELQRLRQLQKVTGLADMTPEDRAYLKTKGREERGRAAVDFERLYLADDETQNLLLEGGDVVFIPTSRRTISISGQLQKPGLVDFEAGRRVDYYLDKAGGYSYGANKGGARLIRARTGIRERLKGNLIVEAGDEIWVPEKEYRNWWAFFQGTMRTVAETLTLVVLIRSF